jgi:DNA-binding winged helix-turn-helix (wHTH) protein/TolB-like protein
MRFAQFDIDPDAGVLRQNGTRIRLQDLPFRLLVVLLRRPGAVVTREELRAELWGAETFVDAEAGLNTAIAKLREALGDNAEAPKFIETLPKRGYRFIGQIATEAPERRTEVRSALRTRTVVRAAAIIGLGALAFAGYHAVTTPPPVKIAVVRFHNETGNPENDRLAGSLTDAVVVSLATNSRYGVIGNSPVLRTDRIFEDVQKIGTALDAEFVVLGQLQTGADGLIVRAHFIRVSDKTHLWASKIDLPGTGDPEQPVTSAVGDGVTVGLKRHQQQ